MKKIILSLSLLFVLASCSEENPIEENVPSISVSSIIRKNYNTSTNAVLNTQTYNLENNKIQSITRTNPVNSELSISTYYYVNNKVSLIETKVNNVLTQKRHYIYNSNDQLIETRGEGYNTAGQIQITSKTTYNRIQGVIYAVWSRNSISSPTFTPVTSSEIILDQNQNVISCKEYDHLNNETIKTETLYDANNNIIKEDAYQLDQNGIYVNIKTNNYTYGTAINTLAFVNIQTFGKETSMLSYQSGNNSGAVNEVDVKSYSPNVLNTFENSLFGPETTFSITNLANSNNYSIYSEYNSYNSNVLFSKFSYEYTFN